MLARLGAGGMGVVYLGRIASGRLVAIKVIRARFADNPEFRARFQREVAAARVISGAFTAPVIDADPDAERPWLVTAYVPGLPLDEAVGTFGPLPPNSLRTLGGCLAEALRSIHVGGVVHRDLKPSNILLAIDGPRVIDFGIARAVDASRLTQTGLLIGSPGFMSPEQASGQPTGPASDIFSYGAVLAYAAAGREPFGGTGPMAAQVYRTVLGEPDLADLDGPWLPELVRACLEKEPSRRPTIEQVLAYLATAAPPAPPGGWLPQPVADTVMRRIQQADHLLDVTRLAAEKHTADRRRASRRTVLKAAGAVVALGAGISVPVVLVSQAAKSGEPLWSGVRVSAVTADPTVPRGWAYAGKAQVTSPHARVGILWAAVGNELDSTAAAGLNVPPLKARPGEQLVVAVIDRDAVYAGFDPDPASPVAVRVRVGDQTTDVRALPLPARSSTTQVIVVGAAVNTPVRLQLVDTGKTAELDLRTSRVITNPYQQHQADIDWTGGATGTAVIDGRQVAVKVALSPRLSPGLRKEVASSVNYDPDTGWTPSDQLHLAVPAPVVRLDLPLPYLNTAIRLDDHNAFTFRTQSGAVIPAIPYRRTVISELAPNTAAAPVLFLIPARTTSGQLVFDLAGSSLADTSTTRIYPWQKAPHAFSLPVTFK